MAGSAITIDMQIPDKKDTHNLDLKSRTVSFKARGDATGMASSIVNSIKAKQVN